MKRTLALFLLLLVSSKAFSQKDRIFTWEEALLAPKDSVYIIDAAKLKWSGIPEELYTFNHLEKLDLSKNRLKEIPEDFGKLKNLRDIDIGKNELQTFPVKFCSMTQITHLRLNRNLITTLPDCVQHLKSLVYLDLWDNPIESLPPSLTKITTLKTVDLRGILFNEEFQTGWRENMPNTTWLFDYPCNCIH